ncbi:winged helix-turn-helix domain-containing protein [Candidatus Pacearchaeota archaeon]|nr:winged helix-turn-helix domain-containing protein [Candidatus Pacearchaeota archaeon]|tara:strand:- start:934 stop:1263 length:330 start_codon:yes stop_codon:yes gene_type:complete
MSQLRLPFDLFDRAHARARRSDPGTSHVAAAEVEASGSAKAQRALCLQTVRSTPGLTAAEIAVVTGLERHAPSRRLPELRDCGLVCNGTARPCRATGRLSLTWYDKGGG